MATKSPTKKVDNSAAACFDLPNAVQGQVVVRFPPEPSGYLHIGHAKAAMLNMYMKTKYEGKLILRFDDTNPSLEKQEFEDSIRADLKLLGVVEDQLSYTSDYFQKFADTCTRMIEEGILYCDDTDVETMRDERGKGIESTRREHTVEENLRRWKEMQAGSPEGLKNVVRAKMNMQDKNKCMRDPVFYRCNIDVPHHRTGTTWKCYPTYDFACPLIDSWEGVTHSMRTNEYADRIPQFFWVQEKAGVRKCELYEFSRMNLVNTCLSKRKLQWIVDTGIVEDWTDPRFPTVRAVIRRGLTKEALLDFMLQQGASKNANLMEWDKLWATNKKVLDPKVPRWAAASADGVTLDISNYTPTTEVRDLHPKNAEVGTAPQHRATKVMIDKEDAEAWKPEEEITLLKFGNVKFLSAEKNAEGAITSIKGEFNPEGDFKKTKKFHWVPVNASKPPCKVELVEYDHLITKKKIEDGDNIADIINRESVERTSAIADPELVNYLKKGDTIQFERRGLFICDDIKESGEFVMIMIPEGKSKNMSVVKSKVDAEHLAKGGVKGAKNAPSNLPLDDPARIALVRGKIVEVWEHPDAEKLWCEKIDIGNGEIRQIASGLRDFYTKEQMLGSDVVVIANLPAKKLRGFESHGMVLCGSNADHTKVEFMNPPVDTPLGEKMFFEGFEGTPDEVLPKNDKKNPWATVQKEFATNADFVGTFKGAVLKSSCGPVKCISISNGTMS